MWYTGQFLFWFPSVTGRLQKSQNIIILGAGVNVWKSMENEQKGMNFFKFYLDVFTHWGIQMMETDCVQW